jgi:hypothetical protein
MTNGGKVALVAGLVIGVLVIAVGSAWVSASNREIGLRNRASAQEDANRVIFDKTWKVVRDQAQVADEYRKAFESIYPKLMEGRYGNERGGALLSFITESNPAFDVSLYGRLQAGIEANRAEFAGVQVRLRDIKREHDNLRLQFPSSIFVGSRPALDVKLVTSDRTEEAFSVGRDNDAGPFAR